MEKISAFKGKYAFLSNFYDSPIYYEGILYPTVEHFFQAMKTLDHDERRTIAAAASPGQAKRLGRRVKLRDDWESVKDFYMKTALTIKFAKPELRQKLLETGSAYLEEGNTWNDTYWGVCNGVGKNRLGLLLMEVRKEIQDNGNE